MPVGEQIAVLYCGIHGLLKQVPLERVTEFQERFLELARSKYVKTVLEPLGSGTINADVEAAIQELAQKAILELGL